MTSGVNKKQGDGAWMLYVHIPFCIQKCQYCDFLSFPTSVEVKTKYVEALQKEIVAWASYDTSPITLSSIFFGGGTPSLLTEEQIKNIMETIRAHYIIEPDAEITIEVNPGTVTLEKAMAWKEQGFNRVSMGVQAMQNELLRKLGRIHGVQEVLESHTLLKEAGFTNISFDLMMGLPGQTLAMWEDTLKQALALKPKHLSCYSLIIEEGTPFYEAQDTLALPDEDTERDMYHLTKELLSEQGFRRYEISNFSQPGFESRHNIGYWRRKPYIGAGLGASSLLVEEVRVQNTGNIEEYLSKKFPNLWQDRQELSIEDQMAEFMFLGLRCSCGVNAETFEHQFGRSLQEVFGKAVQRHIANGLLQVTKGCISLTDKGFDLANQVFMDFLEPDI